MSDELQTAADMLFQAADALMRSRTTSEELRRAKDVRAALDLYAQARNGADEKCSCHSGSVCTEACGYRICHDGCPKWTRA